MCFAYIFNGFLSSSYSIIINIAINETGHVNNVVGGFNATDKCYLKEQMEIIGKLASNDISNILILSSASKYVSIKFADQFIHIINNK